MAVAPRTGRSSNSRAGPLQALVAMAGMGMDAYGVHMMGDYFTAYSNNWGDFVSSDFQTLMGKAPRSWADFSRDFSSAFGGK